MNRSTYIVLLTSLVIAAVTSASCGDQLPTTPAEKQIQPLAVGNWWIGKVTVRDSIGIPSTYQDTIRILSRRTHTPGPPTIYYVDNRGWEHYYIGRELYRKSCDSGMVHELTACGAVALYPAQASDTFSTQPDAKVLLPDPSGGDPQIVDQKIAMMVIATDTTITVEAGTFTCYHYRPTIMEPAQARFLEETDIFYSPGVGMVLFERRYRATGPPHYRWELADYNVQ